MRRIQPARRSFPFRLLAAGMALASLVAIRPVNANPSDIFSLGAPLIGAPGPKTADQNAGDASVSPTGAFQYSYPIAVPPGRNGMQPSLGLTYSSQAPIYGTIAAGWTLGGLHAISLDVSEGRMIYASQVSPKRYTSSMAGGRPLVPVTEPTSTDVVETLRAQNDTSWTRYERMDSFSAFRWRAYTPDGTTFYFGDTDHVSGCAIVSEEWAPITRAVDKFGNAIEYFWRTGPESECRINYITWGQNDPGAGVSSFAAAVFNFTEMPTCAGVPIGSQISFRTGTKIGTGTSRLNSIKVGAFAAGTAAPPPQVIPTTPDHTRVITLSYEAQTEACNAGSSAFRSLASIQESAWGIDSPQVDLPAVLFTYGSSRFGEGPLSWQAADWYQGLPPWQVSPTAPGDRGRHSLGWGFRFDNSQWPTVEAMMLDVDGDGRIDRLSNNPQIDAATNEVVRCRAQWERNMGFGLPFAPPEDIELPTLKWASPGHSSFQGGAFAGQNTDYSSGGQGVAGSKVELCALNYQLSGYVNSFDAGGGGERCPTGEACSANWQCSSTHDDCSNKHGQGTKTILAYRWMDIDGDQRVDLVASPVEGGLTRYNFQHGNQLTAPWEPAIFGGVPWLAPCPSTTFTAYPGGATPADPGRPYTMCGGMFPYFVYKNRGGGQFGISQGAGASPRPDQILYQPVPLETTNGDSSITSLPVGQYQGLVDLDGDGYLDAAKIAAVTLEWLVYRSGQDNGNAGRFMAASGVTPYFYNDAINLFLNRSGASGLGQPPVVQMEGMTDVNADGVADHWFVESNGSVTLRRNNGIGFGVPQVTLSQKPGSDGHPVSDLADSSGFVIRGHRVDKQRPLDIDVDGRVDVLRDPAAGTSLQVYFNEGGEFSGPSGAVAPLAATEHRTTVSDQIPYYWAAYPNAYSWELRSDLLDLDGDGLPEAVSFGQDPMLPGAMSLSRIGTPSQPPRLLATINNQRGATTSVTYTPTTNPNDVVQDPENGKYVPHTQWVVRGHTTTDSLDTPVTSSTTGYKYYSPRFAPDDQGKYGLRGFERIETTLPSGAMREDKYAYLPDWSGRLEKSIMHPAGALTEARTIDITDWDEFELFPNSVPPIRTYHPIISEHLTCLNGQTEATCTPTTAAGYTRTTRTLTPLASTNPGGGPPLMLQEMSSVQSAAVTDANGDRKTDTVYALRADGSNYRLVATSETKSHRVSGAFTMYAKTATTWTDGMDTSYRVPYFDETWVDGVDANRTISRRTYDLLTGNVLQSWKPAQWAANPNPFTNLTRTSFTYDARKLFPASETNEVGHLRDFTWEYGTGTKLRTMGPNLPPCALGPPYPACPSGAPLKEDHRIRIDGLGRMLERFEVFGAPGESSYQTHVVESNVYFDGPAPYVEHKTAIDYNDYTQVVRYAKDRTDLDGHGRPVMKTIDVDGWAPANQVTTFVYSNDGSLAEVKVPDPRTNDATTISYVYTYDSLGRPLTIRRPDAAQLSNRSGVDIQYDGLTTTTTEIVPAGGQSAVTRTRNDSFGRLAQVDEQLTATPAITWSTTSYGYSPDDDIAVITGPQATITALSHDFAGRRTQITRSGRTWQYGYDKNGNMVSETPPCIGTNCEANYVSSTVYDALDRPVSKLNAPRNLTAPDLALFGSSSETFVWDAGWNGYGRISSWKSFGPGATTPTLESSPTWHVQGQPMLHRNAFTGAGYTNEVLDQLRVYDISGALSGEYLGGVIDGSQTCTNGSYAEYDYDSRGLPSQINVNPCLYSAQAVYSYVQNTRNVAGLVTKRNSLAGVGPFHYVEANWTYDELGRVVSQVVNKGPTLAQVVRQGLTYFGNDDPQSLDHYLGATNHKVFTFGYDKRHQLTGVSTTANAFAATYTYGTAGRFETALESAAALPNSDVKARNVTYVYGGSDPERLTALKKTGTTKNLADYTYDEPGNELTRYYPDSKELWQYVYDGKNQLRRVVKRTNNVLQGSEEYWYDRDNVRVMVVKRNASGAVTGAIGSILNAEVHYNAAGSITRSYNHVKLGTTAVRLERSTDGPATVEYQFHGLGDHMIAGVSQADGTINASFMYAPFGEIVEATNAGGSVNGIPAHRRRMNDKFVDEISALGYYGFRYYDKLSMTWTQSDPLYRFAPDAAWTQPRRASLFGFSGNNPLRFVDHDGRDWKEAVAGVAVGVLDFASFGQYSERMLPSLVSDEAMESAFASSDFNDARTATEIILTAAAIASGVGAVRAGASAAGGARLAFAGGGVATAAASVGVVEVTYAAFAAAASGSAIARTSETAAAERQKSQAAGISDKQIGPSGKPKRHSANHSTKKAAKDKAKERAGRKGSTVTHPTPTVGGPHVHGVRSSGEKVRVHDNFPKSKI